MRNASSLQEIVARAFKQALRERDFTVAEFMLQALEDMDSKCPCDTILDDAMRMIDTPTQKMTPPKRRLQ
jgi:hypothetical protein